MDPTRWPLALSPRRGEPITARPAFTRTRLADGQPERPMMHRRTVLAGTGAVLRAAPLAADARQASGQAELAMLTVASACDTT